MTNTPAPVKRYKVMAEVRVLVPLEVPANSRVEAFANAADLAWAKSREALASVVGATIVDVQLAHATVVAT